MRWALLSEIVRLIRDKKADYVLAIKTNHPTLHAQVKNWFDKAQAARGVTTPLNYVLYAFHSFKTFEIKWEFIESC